MRVHGNSENKKKKAGRPAKIIKREIRASIRFTKSEYFIIREKASKAGINVSAYIRQVTINGLVKSRLTDEDRVYVRKLVGMANNLNQVAKCCHVEGVLKAILYFENYRNEIDWVLKKLRSDK
jgi:hypothetical protein